MSPEQNRQMHIFDDGNPGRDYWMAIRSELDWLHKVEERSFDECNLHLVENINKSLKYMDEIYYAHQNSLNAIAKYLDQGQPFVLYLRNFSFSGSKQKLSHNSNNKRTAREWGYREFISDMHILPALQAHLKKYSVITLANMDMFGYKAGACYETAAFRAHGYNWINVIELLIKAAKIIVLLIESYKSAVADECRLIKKHMRMNDTICVVHVKSPNIDLDKISNIGSVIYSEEFSHHKFTYTMQETLDMMAKQAKSGSYKLKEPEISEVGKKLINDKIKQAKDTKIDLTSLLKQQCFVIGRDFNDFPDKIDPSSRGLFIPLSKVHLLEQFINIKNLLNENNDKLNAELCEGCLTKEEKQKKAFKIVLLSTRLFAIATELEQIDWMSDTFLFLLSRYYMSGLELKRLKAIFNCGIYVDSLTEKRENTEKFNAIIAGLLKGSGSISKI